MKKNRLPSAINMTILFLFVILTLFPFYLMIATSTKSTYTFATNFWGISFPIEWGNYGTAWKTIYPYILNTLYVALWIVFGQGLVTILAGYAFARMNFKGKNALYTLLIMFQMIPAALMLTIKFVIAFELNLYNTYLGVILPSLTSITNIMITRSFFEGLPEELFESMRLDGAGEGRIITNLLIPLSKPIIGTNALFTFIYAFNDYLWPFLILNDESKKTIAVGLKSLAGQFSVNYGVQMAAYSLIAIPLMILIACMMKSFIQGITGGAVKG